MTARKKAKFRVGQVVMINGTNACMKIGLIEFKLKGTKGQEDWRYFGGGFYCWESQLRPLTKREKGEDR